jgi:hypothetical protein
MKFGIKVGDLVKYNVRHSEAFQRQEYKMGIAIKMLKCSSGREIHVVWSNGALTHTSVHFLRKVML